jgi:hypothetical protein
VLRRRDKGGSGAAGQAPDNAGPPRWLQLAQSEIDVRTQVGAGGRHDFLDHMLQMEARLKSEYPDMPFEAKTEFNARLHARGYSEEAWDAAVAWLESTDWFRLRGRYLGNV